jgi:hypothetical protein
MFSKNYYIGVTGHRTIPDEDLIRSKIQETIQNIHKSTKSNLIVISPLAEGADRLVAQESLRCGNKLKVVLPLELTDYMDDFKTIESKDEFLDLLNNASEVVTLKEAPTRKDAYLQVGHYVANHSDILIAIWDGLPSRGKGGTAEIIDYQRKNKKALYWINSQTGKIKHEEY